LAGTAYLERARELLTAAAARDPECQAAVLEDDSGLQSLVLFGPVAGATDVWRIRLLVLGAGTEPREIGRSIVGAALDGAREAGGRMLTAELPADPVLGSSLTALRATGFRQDGRVPDFFRDGVALLFFSKEL
jgi:hypothetical protein